MSIGVMVIHTECNIYPTSCLKIRGLEKSYKDFLSKENNMGEGIFLLKIMIAFYKTIKVYKISKR
jgi:hypothetical protein